MIEAVPAVRELQIEIFGTLDGVCAPHVVLGSTSGQPISLMTGADETPERAVAMHFIYPAQLIPIVEVCGGPANRARGGAVGLRRDEGRGPDTGADEQGGRRFHHQPPAVRGTARGLVDVGQWHCHGRGDRPDPSSCRSGGAIRSPVRSRAPSWAASTSCTSLPNSCCRISIPRRQPPAAVADLVKAGHFGLKTGKGVYDWSTRDGKALLAARADKLFEHMREDARKKD